MTGKDLRNTVTHKCNLVRSKNFGKKGFGNKVTIAKLDVQIQIFVTEVTQYCDILLTILAKV